jgi:hypothetical protein
MKLGDIQRGGRVDRDTHSLTQDTKPHKPPWQGTRRTREDGCQASRAEPSRRIFQGPGQSGRFSEAAGSQELPMVCLDGVLLLSYCY